MKNYVVGGVLGWMDWIMDRTTDYLRTRIRIRIIII